MFTVNVYGSKQRTICSICLAILLGQCMNHSKQELEKNGGYKSAVVRTHHFTLYLFFQSNTLLFRFQGKQLHLVVRVLYNQLRPLLTVKLLRALSKLLRLIAEQCRVRSGCTNALRSGLILIAKALQLYVIAGHRSYTNI